ncbi:cytochrome c-type biogenesis protein [Pseudoduganella flava]|uniref:cytochrome c-type biogenesis protein n=1 Tax=Pseudoduganella flava TaxID=871742 RepID=UPI0027D9434A|nr:cytochrome c-type biogenesis protein [Pseudoduganella flava]
MLVAICLLAGAAGAAPSGAELDRRTAAVAEELRCLVCQNQTIADSHAELAVDLRRQVREQLAQGRTPDQVVAFMTERYGDFVVYRPPLRGSTMLLWFGPALLLVAGLAMLYRRLRARTAPPAVPDTRRAEAARLLDDEEAKP